MQEITSAILESITNGCHWEPEIAQKIDWEYENMAELRFENRDPREI